MSFLVRVIETTLVHLTAGATARVVEKSVDKGLEKGKELYRKARGLEETPIEVSASSAIRELKSDD